MVVIVQTVEEAFELWSMGHTIDTSLLSKEEREEFSSLILEAINNSPRKSAVLDKPI